MISDRIIPEDLVSNSDLIVNFVHKDLHLKDGFQISPVDQVEMLFKGMWICKEESILISAAKQGSDNEGRRATPLTR